jgi:hypothetical protein
MRGKDKEQWIKLCDQAADEQDRERFQELASDIILTLRMKSERLSPRNRILKTDRSFRDPAGTPGTGDPLRWLS